MLDIIQKPKQQGGWLSTFQDEPVNAYVGAVGAIDVYYDGWKNSEAELVDHLNNDLAELNEVLYNWCEVIHYTRIKLIITDDKVQNSYNQIPGYLSLTTHKVGTRDAKITLSTYDTSSLVHELAHTFDMSNIKSESDDFRTLADKLKVIVSDVCNILQKYDYISVEVNPVQINYETQNDELFAVIMNDWYNRTHTPNSFSTSRRPIITEMVIDNLMVRNKSAFTSISDYCMSITPWIVTNNSHLCNYDYHTDNTIHLLEEALKSVDIDGLIL